MSGHSAIAAQHEDVVAEDLKVVLREVARVTAFVVTIGHLAVCLHRQVTTKTTRHPRRMTSDAGHIVIAMRELIGVRRNVSPLRMVFANGLRVSRLLVAVTRT